MIDRGDIRQAIDRCSNIWASLPGAGYGRSGIRLTAWLQNSKKRAERSEIDVWAESPRLSPLWLSASSSACHGLLIITGDNAITYKAQRDKNAEIQAGERGNYWHADASAWCCCARCKIHEGVSLMLKLKMMLCVMMLPLVVVSCTSKQSVDQCVKPPPPPAWIMQPPPDWQTPLNGIISPSEKADHWQNNWKEPEVY